MLNELSKIMLGKNGNNHKEIKKKKDFKSETVTGNKGHYIVIKGSVHQGDSNYKYYTSNIRVLKYRKQTMTELKVETDSNKIKAGDFNIPFSVMNRITSWRSIWKGKKLEQWHKSIELTPHPTTAECLFFSKNIIQG